MPNGFSQSGCSVRVTGITHAATNTYADQLVTGQIGPDEWNDDHVITGGQHGQFLMRDTTQSAGFSFTGATMGYIGCQNNKSTTQSLSNSTWTPVRFTDADTWDSDSIHDPSTNNGERFVVPAGMSGKWMFMVRVSFATNATGNRYLRFAKNGTQIQGNMPDFTPTSTANATVHASTQLDLVAGDYVSIEAHQDISGGGALNITGVADFFKLESGRIGQGIGCIITEATAQSLSNDTPTVLTSNDAEILDTDGFHDTGSNTSRLTIPTGLGGKYVSVGTIFYATNATGGRAAAIYTDGADQGLQQRSASFGSSAGTYVTVTAILDLTAAQYIELYGNQTSGGALNATLIRFSLLRIDSGATNNPGSHFSFIEQTSGNITMSASQTTMVEASSGLRISIAATVDDILQIGVNTLFSPGSGGGETMVDSATVVSGSIVNQCSPGTKHVGHGYNATTTGIGLNGVISYKVVSGDISNGTVTLTLTYSNSSGNTGIIYASSTYALRYWVMNMGH